MRPSIRVGLAALALLPAAAAAPDASATPSRWSGNGHLYEVRADPNGLSWPQALLRADALGCGWYLATLTSAAENAFVSGLVARQPAIFAGPGGIVGPWLGAFQRNRSNEPAGNWRWVTEEPFRYTNWNRGEPNDAGGSESFLNFWNNGAWNDVDPFGTAALPKGFVVEFDSVRQRRCRRLG